MRRSALRNRAPWALTLYFSFFLLLLVWGRLPEEPNQLVSSGVGTVSSAGSQFFSELLPNAYCPACGDPRRTAGNAGMPLTFLGGSIHPDGKNASVADQSNPFVEQIRKVFTNRIVPFPPISDSRLTSLRTVVLLH
jgi:hypothetical protein